MSFCGTYVSLRRDKGKTSAHRRRQQDMHRHVFQSTSSACSYMCHFMMHVYRSNGTRASGGAPASATGLSPASIPINIDRQLVDRHSSFDVHIYNIYTPKYVILWYICIAIEGRGALAGAPATGHARRNYNHHRPLAGAPAQRFGGTPVPCHGTYIVYTRYQVYIIEGRGATTGTPAAATRLCSGTYANHHRPLSGPLAQHF